MESTEYGVYTRRGKLYLSAVRFAERMGVTRAAVTRAKNKGVIAPKKLKGIKEDVYDFEVMSKRWENSRTQSTKITVGERKQQIESASLIPVSSSIKVGVPEIEVPDFEYKDISTEVGIGKNFQSVLDLFPIENFYDCFLLDENKEPLFYQGDKTKPMLNPKLTKEKVYSMLLALQYQEKDGQLVSKEEVENTIAKLFKPLTAAINQIPERLSAKIVALLEALLEKRFSNDVKTELRNVFDIEVVNILNDFKQRVQDEIEIQEDNAE